MVWHPCDETPDAARPRRLVARAPVRAADLGGWTDTWFAGRGCVLSVAVEPGVTVTVDVLTPGALPAPVVVERPDQPGAAPIVLRPGAPLPGADPLLEAAVAACVLPAGADVRVTVGAAVPPGSALGTSAAVVVAVLAALEALTPGRSRAGELAREAHRVETGPAGRQAGVQDHVAAAYGGLLWIEVDPYPTVRVERLGPRLAPATLAALHGQLVVVALPEGHDSSALHATVVERLTAPGDGPGAARGRAALEALRAAAHAGRAALLAGDLAAYGRALDAATAGQAALHPALVGPAARRTIDAARAAGATAAKVNGAGGDGGSLTLLVPPAARAAVVDAVGATGAVALDLVPAEHGVRVGTSA